MLKLRKVELVGFKSFCEKTHLTFSGTGLSCIIGPNGCGKSNIVDAISWVLGEQSHKSLRAERMSDCIFNGTARRPPMGLAQVTLTLVDPELSEAARAVLGEAPAETQNEPVVEITEVADDAFSAPEENADSDAAGSENEIVAVTAAIAPETEDAAKSGRKKRQPKPVHQMRPGEVVIGRRIYRSGQSEYLINGRAARLRDIQELFMGIGLGPDSYAIIEQGRIGQVLSSKPSDRRAIIEEAAGITKYKTKKRLAETKLESSKLNLSRVNDIYVEVEKQLASLKRQAAKAKRYAELREQMRGLLRQVLASKALELDGESKRLTQALEHLVSEETRETQSILQLETEQQQLDLRIDQISTELRELQNQIGHASLDLDRSENRILFNKQRIVELSRRGEQLAGEHGVVEQQAAQVSERFAAQNGVVGQLEEERRAVDAAVAALVEKSTQLSGWAKATEAQIDSLRRQIGQLDEAINKLQIEQTRSTESLAHHSGALERLEQSEQQLLQESLHSRERSHVAEIRWQGVSEEARQSEEAEHAARELVAALKREHQETAMHNDQLRDSVAGTRAKLTTLEQVLQDRAYTAEAVQKLFAPAGNNASRNFRPVGVLADYAEVAPEYEQAIEQFLREELEYVVVENFDHARAGVALLRDEMGGRATFFVDSLRALNLSDKAPVNTFAGEPGVVSRLDQLLEFRDPLGAAAKQFLPRLETAFLVESGDRAEQLSRQHRQYSFVTTDGTCYQGRSVTGGRPAEAGPLVMKRELRALETELTRLEQEATEAQARLQQLAARRLDAEQVLAEATARAVASGKSVVGATLERDQARNELVRLGVELAECQKEIAKVRGDAQSAKEQANRAMTEQQQMALARTVAERQMAEAGSTIATTRQAAEDQQEELSAKRVEKAAIEERFASAAAIASRLQEELTTLGNRQAALAEQQRSIGEEQLTLSKQNEEYEQQTVALRLKRASLEETRTNLEHEWEQGRSRIAEVDNAARTARQRLADLREERSQREVERARNESEREHLLEACRNELNQQPEELIGAEATLLTGEELAAADANYREMKDRMTAMGAVNMMALEEYTECEQRFEFLGRERQDLLQSIQDTQQAITELDEISRQKFEDAFANINRHFATAFQTLFGGGTGQMRLTEADTSGETGIEIAAQPPGKRLQNVLLLSGGEKALTALALLIAVFRYQPSPFCILDEVDAPLDETNVGRFAQMLEHMSTDAQFIVVTHNRRTMEKASVLYGVTMQEPGVSKLVSVSWEQAQTGVASHAA